MRCELGNEPSIEAYVDHLVEVCREIWRVLRPDGTFWLNLGDSYARDQAKGQHKRGQSGRCSRHAFDDGAGRSGAAPGDGLKPKDLVMVPARVALALQADGWYLRNDVVWHRKNAKPESVRDRFSMDYEHVFLLTKAERYYFDQEAVREQHSSPADDIAKQRKGKRYGTQGYAKAMGATSSPGRDNFGGLGFAAGGRNRRCVWLDETQHLRLRADLSAEEQERAATVLEQFFEPAEEDLSSIWSINTKPYPGAHFACFPGDLAKIPLLAGNSAGGACVKCGAPRLRVTTKGEPDRAWQLACGGNDDGRYSGVAQKDYASSKAENASDVKRRILEGMRPKITLGWALQCRCWGEPARVEFPRPRRDRKRQQREASGSWRKRVERALAAPPGAVGPCRALDPFAGSGTVGEVAHQIGLDCTLIELQPDYMPLIEARVAKAGGTVHVVGRPTLQDARRELVEALEDAAWAHWTRPLASPLVDDLRDEWPGEERDEDSGWLEDHVVPAFSWAAKDGE